MGFEHFEDTPADQLRWAMRQQERSGFTIGIGSGPTRGFVGVVMNRRVGDVGWWTPAHARLVAEELLKAAEEAERDGAARGQSPADGRAS